MSPCTLGGLYATYLLHRGPQMNHSLLKSCLATEFYAHNKSKLRSSLFDDSVKEVFDALVESHEKFDTDVSPLELFTYWKAINPTSTAAWTAEIEDTINCIGNSEPIAEAIATDVIENLWRQSVGLDIANYGILMSEGDVSAFDKLNRLLDRVSDGYLPDDFGDNCTDDIYELLAVTSNDNRWKFNIETLARNVHGIGAGEFGCIAAYSNVGKTALAISLCAAPKGFCSQGAKVVYICNEEVSKRTKLRAIGAYTGMTRDEIDFDPAAAWARYSGIKDRLIFVDAQGWDIQTLEGYLNKERCDICIVDMADKIEVNGNFNSGHERLRELYYRLRECSKKFNCALIGVSQASAEAEGRTRLSMSMLEGSKVGKQSELDLLLGIGRMTGGEDENDPSRWITVMKNKISGWHGTVQCNLEGEVNRYVV